MKPLIAVFLVGLAFLTFVVLASNSETRPLLHLSTGCTVIGGTSPEMSKLFHGVRTALSRMPLLLRFCN